MLPGGDPEEHEAPEGYDAELAERNAELIKLTESTEESDWRVAFNELTKALNLTVWSETVDHKSQSALQDSYVADCYRLTVVASKLQKVAEKRIPPRYEEIIYLTRIRIRAQRFSREYAPEDMLNNVQLQIRFPTDKRIGEAILRRRDRLRWIRRKVEEGNEPKSLRLQLAKASLETMGAELEEIAKNWAVSSKEKLENCIDICFSYFTQQVVKRFPETGWINIPTDVEGYLDYEEEKMHQFVEIGTNHLRNSFANRANRILKSRSDPPETVIEAINRLIDANTEFLEN